MFIQYAVGKTYLWKVEVKKARAVWEKGKASLIKVQGSERNKDLVYICGGWWVVNRNWWILAIF